MSKSLPTVTIFKDGHSHVKGNDNNNDEAYGTLIAQAVDVEEIDVGWTRSKQLWKPFTARGVFGGQVVAQALMAAAKTVESHFSLHSLHSYFILPGDNQLPILYQVERLRDGKSYATRSVKAMQRGRAIFTAIFSFAVADTGISIDHQDTFPQVPDPETLPSDEMRVEELLKHPDLEIPEKYRTYLETRLQEQSPVDFREVHVATVEELARLKPVQSDRQQVWFKCHGKLNDDPVLHQAVLAYASDSHLLHTAVRRSGLARTQIGMMASLDHAVWFHAPFRADEWLLYDMVSPRANSGRGMTLGRIFRRDGTLVATTAQEGIIRLSLREQEKRRQRSKAEKESKI